jgi:HrpA-like RNA helicase
MSSEESAEKASTRIYTELGNTLNDAAINAILNGLVDSTNLTHAYYAISGTGTGKSTLIPPAFMRYSFPRGKEEVPAKIVVTVPTRIAVRSLYNTVSEARDSNGNLLVDFEKIGYAAESEVEKEDANLRYVTTEHFLRRFLQYYSGRGDLQCDFLIVDEIHTGTIANEIILKLWMKIRDQGRNIRVPYLLLASANDVDVSIPNVPRGMISSTPPFSIEEVYAVGEYNLKESLLYSDAGKEAARYAARDLGNILVFLPGRMEIEVAKRAFEAQNVRNTFAIAVEGNISRKRARELNGLDAAFGKKLVIFATNAAETSLTIKDLGVVVDTLTEKIMYCAPDESSILSTQYISKDSSLQRRGRTGRLRSGIYHVMMTRKNYELLNQGRATEITRVPLSQYVLLLEKNKLNGHEILSRAGITRLEASYKLVRDVGALNEKGELTTRGRFCSRMPMSVRVSSFVYDVFEEGKNRRSEFDVVMALTLASIIENFDSNYYVYPENVDRKAYYEEYFAVYCSEGSENSLQGRLMAWNVVLHNALSNFPAGQTVTTKDCLEAIQRVSEELSLSPYLNRDIYRTFLYLRERAFSSKVKINIESGIIVGDVIPKEISQMLSLTFPIYQRGTRRAKAVRSDPYYLLSSRDLQPYNCPQRTQTQHDTVVALSTIRIQIGEEYTDKISLFSPILSLGTRDNSNKAIEKMKRSAEITPSKKTVDPTELTIEEMFGFVAADGEPESVGTLMKKTQKTKMDYIFYVDTLHMLPTHTSFAGKEAHNVAKEQRKPYLPIRFQDISDRARTSEILRSNIYNILLKKKGAVVVLDPHPLNVKSGMVFTSEHEEDVYLGALCRKRDLPQEKITFLLTREPDADMLAFLRARKNKTYASFPSDYSRAYMEDLYTYDYSVERKALKPEERSSVPVPVLSAKRTFKKKSTVKKEEKTIWKKKNDLPGVPGSSPKEDEAEEPEAVSSLQKKSEETNGDIFAQNPISLSNVSFAPAFSETPITNPFGVVSTPFSSSTPFSGGAFSSSSSTPFSGGAFSSSSSTTKDKSPTA